MGESVRLHKRRNIRRKNRNTRWERSRNNGGKGRRGSWEATMSLKEEILYNLECARREDRELSGEELAGKLGVSRMAVCKAVNTLREEGVEISSRRGGGYRMARQDLLSSAGRMYGLEDHGLRRDRLHQQTGKALCGRRKFHRGSSFCCRQPNGRQRAPGQKLLFAGIYGAVPFLPLFFRGSLTDSDGGYALCRCFGGLDSGALYRKEDPYKMGQ